MAYDIERLTRTGETEASPLSPEEVAARNGNYNAKLYGNLPDGINEPTGDVKTPGDQDESRQFFGEATAIAAEKDNTLDADKEHPDGFKTVKVRYGGTGIHHPPCRRLVYGGAPRNTTSNHRISASTY